MKVYNSLNARKTVFPHESPSGKSETVPGMVVPLADMLRRYANGVPLTGTSAPPAYYGEDTPVDPRSIDLADLASARDNLDSMMAEYERQQAVLKARKAKESDPVQPVPGKTAAAKPEPLSGDGAGTA